MCPVTLLPLVLISLACARIVWLLPDHLFVLALNVCCPALRKSLDTSWQICASKIAVAGVINVIASAGFLMPAASVNVGGHVENAACWIVAEMFRTIWQACS